MSGRDGPTTRRVYSLRDWMQMSPEERQALSRRGGAGAFATLAWGAGRLDGAAYTPEDVRALRRYLLVALEPSDLNPLDRSPERLKRLENAVAAWVRTPANHGGRLSYSPPLVERLIGDAVGLGVIDPLLAIPTVTEITVAAPDEIAIEQEGQILHLSRDREGRPTKWRYASASDLLDRIDFLHAWAGGKGLSLATPQVTITLRDGSRIVAMGPPASKDGMMVIRRRSQQVYRLADLVRLGSLTEEMADQLRLYVRSGVGVLVAGPSGSGKTTLLEALVGEIPPSHKVVLIQESTEIRRAAFPASAAVIMEQADPEARPGEGASLSVLARGARLLGPQRIIVGEVKGAEAAEMLAAATAGTRGPMCTLHANSAAQAYDRLLDCALRSEQYREVGPAAIEGLRRDIAAFFPVCVHMGVDEGPDYRRRFVTQIVEVAGPRGTGWDLRVMASGQSVGGQVSWSTAADEEHVAAVAEAIAALPPTGALESVRTAEDLPAEKSGQALDLLAQAETARRLGDLDAALHLLEQAAGLSPDNSIVLAARGEVQAAREQQRRMWQIRLEQVASQVRLLMEAGDEAAVRGMLPVIGGIEEAASEERERLLGEVQAWLKRQEERWAALPEESRSAVRQAVSGGQMAIALAWGELFFRAGNDAAARAAFSEVCQMSGSAALQGRAKMYLEILAGGQAHVV